MSDNNQINSSVYNIQDEWLNQIASRYFDINDINKLRLGLFGYVNEVMSDSLEDTIHLFNMYSNEIFPNKAVLPDSIYSYSALADYSEFNAVPAEIEFYLALRLNDVLAHATDQASYKELVIDRHSKLVLDDRMSYVLDYDVVIKIKEVGSSDYVISAHYDFNYTNPLSNISNPYITVVIYNVQGHTYVYLQLKARQVEQSEQLIDVIGTNILENLYYEISYEQKLADFNVYYRAPRDTDYVQLTKYFIDEFNPTTDPFCFYSYPAESRISIYFSAHPNYFKPEPGSSLKIELFTTYGAEGNFKYSGINPRFNIIDPNDYTRYLPILTEIKVISNSRNGKDPATLEEIRSRVVESFSSRKNIVTGYDLQREFDKQYIEESRTLFIKKRDDLLRRVFSSYILLKQNNEVVPSNTIDLVIYPTQFDNYDPNTIDEKFMVIKAGHKFVELHETERLFETLDTELTLTELVNRESTEKIVCCPFLIRVTRNPLYINYYLTSVFMSYLTEYEYLNESVLNEIVVIDVSIERNAISSDSYELAFKFRTTLNQMELIDIDSNGNITDLMNLRIYGIISENNINVGYIKFSITGYDSTENYYTATASIETNDYISADEQLMILNSVYLLDANNEIIQEHVYLSADNIRLKLLVFYNGYENKEKSGYEQLIPGLDDYCLTSIHSVIEDITLFTNISPYTHSTALQKYGEGQADGNIYYKLKSVPVIRYSYLLLESKTENVISMIQQYNRLFDDLKYRLENNFDIDFKFYNTYGYSQYFVARNRDQSIELNDINIALEFNIKIRNINNETVKSNIYNSIRQFVESANDSNGYLYISNLIREIETNYRDEVIYMEFVSLNRLEPDYQSIENTVTDPYTLTRDELKRYVPEFININQVSKLDSYGNLIYELDIKLNFI